MTTTQEKTVAQSIAGWIKNVSDPSYPLEQALDEDPTASSFEEVEEAASELDIEDITAESLDSHGNFFGEGHITYKNGDYFTGHFLGRATDRDGVLTRISDSGTRIEATWINNRIHGYASIEHKEGGWSQGTFHRGHRHGYSRHFGASRCRDDNLKSVAFYCNGAVYGKMWKGLIGGSYLIGTVGPNSSKDTAVISGTDCIYIFPDFSGAIYGHFENDKLVQGFATTITGAAVNFPSGILIPSVDLSITKRYSALLQRDLSTNRCISKTPLMPDTWESSRVEVRQSELSDDAGEGLFARKAIRGGQVVALFNGIRKQFLKCEEFTSDYVIRLNSQVDLDIPDELTELQDYCATLGHKANHSFNPNSKWSRLEHPRFGLICSITALRDITADEEILVNYGLGLDHAPFWYKKLWVSHCKQDKKMTNQEILDWCGRQYALKGHIIEVRDLLTVP